MAFRCVVVTPEQQAMDESAVNEVILPAHDGLMGILTDRAPLLVKLGIGPLRVDLAGGQSRTYFIDGGIAQMKSNNLTILTNQAVLPEDIDAESARAELAEAQARRASDAKAIEERDRGMARGREKLKLVGKK